jgi:hypothetical protein
LIKEAQSIQSCIAHCKNTFTDIRELVDSAYDHRAKDELNKALHSMDVCIKQCEAALNNAR